MFQRDYSTRFLEVFDELTEKQLIGSMKEFCKKMDYLPQSMSQVRSGKRDVTIELIVKLYYEYGGNPVFVLLGVGEKILDKKEIPAIPKKSLSLDSSTDERLIRNLEELVESKNDYIVMLKKEIDRLTFELGSRGK